MTDFQQLWLLAKTRLGFWFILIGCAGEAVFTYQVIQRMNGGNVAQAIFFAVLFDTGALYWTLRGNKHKTSVFAIIMGGFVVLYHAPIETSHYWRLLYVTWMVVSVPVTLYLYSTDGVLLGDTKSSTVHAQQSKKKLHDGYDKKQIKIVAKENPDFTHRKISEQVGCTESYVSRVLSR